MSRSGEIFRPWRVMSSPVLTMIVSALGSINSYRPRRSLEAPTPPARAAMVFVFAADIVRGLPYYLVGRLCSEGLQPSLSDGFRMTPVYILRQRRDCQFDRYSKFIATWHSRWHRPIVLRGGSLSVTERPRER